MSVSLIASLQSTITSFSGQSTRAVLQEPTNSRPQHRMSKTPRQPDRLPHSFCWASTHHLQPYDSATIIMKLPPMILSALSASSAIYARPFTANSLRSRELKNTLSTVEIHSSCKPYERRQLVKALADTYEVVSVARDYVLDNGHSDAVYKLYFGQAEPFTVVGVFEWLISADKTGVLLRCDDPDRNCATQDSWNGHWRGENATL
ncbi:Prenylated Rab acceptor protein 1 [Stygiomarasmius scandens]|uniref:Prenylated Rab acceptor protein 1 n=1 Tax=Marasmiellus scandens TaxID=2682957 RepID=A0ABR1J9N9_9AGAR